MRPFQQFAEQAAFLGARCLCAQVQQIKRGLRDLRKCRTCRIRLFRACQWIPRCLMSFCLCLGAAASRARAARSAWKRARKALSSFANVGNGSEALLGGLRMGRTVRPAPFPPQAPPSSWSARPHRLLPPSARPSRTPTAQNASAARCAQGAGNFLCGNFPAFLLAHAARLPPYRATELGKAGRKKKGDQLYEVKCKTVKN